MKDKIVTFLVVYADVFGYCLLVLIVVNYIFLKSIMMLQVSPDTL